MITIQEIEELKSQVAMHINAPYRYYHNMDHIEDIIAHVLDSNFDEHMKDLGILFALYHDIVYLPWNTDNEEKSIELMKVIIPSKYRKHLDAIEELIRYSKYAWEDSSKLPEWVWDILKFDIWGLISYGVDIPKNEFAIFKEYQFVDFDVYKKKRIEVLKAFDNKIKLHTNINKRIEFLNNFQPRIGVFAGTFDNFHVGHRNVLEKAEKIFDKVIVATGINSEKNINHKGLIESIKKSVVHRQVECYDTLLTTYLDSKSYPVTLIRGLRNGDDLAYEQNLSNILRDVKGSPLDICYFVCDREYEYVSSSVVRTLKKFGIENLYV